MSNKYRILLIDDDVSISETLQILLESYGYTVDIASTGKEAIEKTDKNFFNLAIVDWKLPDIDGTKLLGLLRETSPRMVKIMLTGFPSVQNAIDSINAHADAFLQKPVDPEDLLRMIDDLISKQQQAKNREEQKIAEFISDRIQQISDKPT